MTSAKAIRDIIATPVSPELKKGQVTEDTIGPYELHDFYLYYFVRHGMRPSEILKLAVKEFESEYDAVTIEMVVETFLHGVDDAGGGFNIHIRNADLLSAAGERFRIRNRHARFSAAVRR